MPPYSLRDVQAEQAQRLHRLDERVGIFVAMLHRRRHRDDLAIDELADRPRDQPLIVVQLKHSGLLGLAGCRRTAA